MDFQVKNIYLDMLSKSQTTTEVVRTDEYIEDTFLELPGSEPEYQYLIYMIYTDNDKPNDEFSIESGYYKLAVKV